MPTQIEFKPSSYVNVHAGQLAIAKLNTILVKDLNDEIGGKKITRRNPEKIRLCATKLGSEIGVTATGKDSKGEAVQFLSVVSQDKLKKCFFDDLIELMRSFGCETFAINVFGGNKDTDNLRGRILAAANKLAEEQKKHSLTIKDRQKNTDKNLIDIFIAGGEIICTQTKIEPIELVPHVSNVHADANKKNKVQKVQEERPSLLKKPEPYAQDWCLTHKEIKEKLQSSLFEKLKQPHPNLSGIANRKVKAKEEPIAPYKTPSWVTRKNHKAQALDKGSLPNTNPAYQEILSAKKRRLSYILNSEKDKGQEASTIATKPPGP